MKLQTAEPTHSPVAAPDVPCLDKKKRSKNHFTPELFNQVKEGARRVAAGELLRKEFLAELPSYALIRGGRLLHPVLNRIYLRVHEPLIADPSRSDPAGERLLERLRREGTRLLFWGPRGLRREDWLQQALPYTLLLRGCTWMRKDEVLFLAPAEQRNALESALTWDEDLLEQRCFVPQPAGRHQVEESLLQEGIGRSFEACFWDGARLSGKLLGSSRYLVLLHLGPGLWVLGFRHGLANFRQLSDNCPPAVQTLPGV